MKRVGHADAWPTTKKVRVSEASGYLPYQVLSQAERTALSAGEASI